MTRLCDQFVGASVYVLAAPMWSLSFPGILKDYLDCIVQTGKTITFDPDDQRPRGLLDDRERSFLYVQSSGGNIPWLARPALNKGLNYVEDLMKFIGIRHVETLLVDDTGTTAEEGRHAIEKAKDKIETVLERLELRGRAVAGVLGDSGAQRL
jgi:FMN-dependent NADH-azoreductase